MAFGWRARETPRVTRDRFNLLILPCRYGCVGASISQPVPGRVHPGKWPCRNRAISSTRRGRRPLDWTRYTEIYFAPGNTDRLRQMTWGKSSREARRSRTRGARRLRAGVSRGVPQGPDPGSSPSINPAQHDLRRVRADRIHSEQVRARRHLLCRWAAFGVAGYCGGERKTDVTTPPSFEARMKAARRHTSRDVRRSERKSFDVNARTDWYGQRECNLREWAYIREDSNKQRGRS